MRRIATTLIILSMLLLTERFGLFTGNSVVNAGSQPTAAGATALSGTLTVDHAAGRLSDTFTLLGSGFEQGDTFAQRLVAPDGTRFLMVEREAPVILTAGRDGQFQARFAPADAFARVEPGRWQVEICRTWDQVCWTAAITILGA